MQFSNIIYYNRMYQNHNENDKVQVYQKESKQVSVDSWLLKLLLGDMKAKRKSKDQSTIIKNNIKVKNN